MVAIRDIGCPGVIPTFDSAAFGQFRSFWMLPLPHPVKVADSASGPDAASLPFKDAGKAKADEMLNSIIPTQVYFGRLIKPVFENEKLGEEDAARLSAALNANVSQWSISTIMATLLVGANLSFVFSTDANVDLDDTAAYWLQVAFAILGTVVTAFLTTSLVFSTTFSAYASILTHAEDIAFFFTIMPTSWPGTLNVVALVIFMINAAVGTLLHFGLVWYAFVCALVWLSCDIGLLCIYSTLTTSFSDRWRSPSWRERHAGPELSAESSLLSS